MSVHCCEDGAIVVRFNYSCNCQPMTLVLVSLRQPLCYLQFLCQWFTMKADGQLESVQLTSTIEETRINQAPKNYGGATISGF